VSKIFLKILAILKLFAFIVGTILIVLIHVVWFILTRRLDITLWFHKYCCFIFNIKVKVIGQDAEQQKLPVIYLCNHLSYLDVVVLGSFLDGCFVAKSEVAGWPGFGFLAKLQKTIFIVREKASLTKSREAIGQAVAEGYNIILFPEGTSTDGWDVLQFKSGLLNIFFNEEAAQEEGLPKAVIQPVAIKHTHTNGMIVTKERQDLRDFYAWYADMDLVPHLWALAHIKRTNVEVYLLEPLTTSDFVHRHDIANAAYDRVAKIVKAT
jgi:1-acyl-sn-glycerol-3-phosphate acyltransferase